MGNSYQMVILKRGLVVVCVILNVFGLWPFRFVHRNRQIKYSPLKATYSIFLLFCGMISYQVIGSITFNGDSKAFLGSFTLRFVLLIYAQSVLTSFMFAYLGVHWFSKEIENVYVQCLNLVNEIGNSYRNIELSGYIFGIAMRMIVTEIVNAIISFVYMTSFETSSDIISSRPYLVLILQLPPYAARLVINIFYDVVVAIDVLIRIMNTRLASIVVKATESARHKHIEMCNYCNCSDEIDKLSKLHSNLAQATKSINLIFLIHIVMWTTTIVVTLTVQLLNQVISIIQLHRHHSKTAVVYNVYGCMAIILSTFDQLSMSNACQKLNDSVRYWSNEQTVSINKPL